MAQKKSYLPEGWTPPGRARSVRQMRSGGDRNYTAPSHGWAPPRSGDIDRHAPILKNEEPEETVGVELTLKQLGSLIHVLDGIHENVAGRLLRDVGGSEQSYYKALDALKIAVDKWKRENLGA